MDQGIGSYGDYFAGRLGAWVHLLCLHLGRSLLCRAACGTGSDGKGIPVHIETLKISLWPRAVVTLKNVELLDPGVPPEARRPVALLHEADVALNWKELIDGQVVPERLNVKGLDVNLPVDAEKPERVFPPQG